MIQAQKTGPEVREHMHSTKVGADDCHYMRNLLAASDIAKYITDMATDISIIRDNDSGMLANLNIDLHESLYGGDSITIRAEIAKEGNRSRTYSFTLHKTISFFAPHWDRKYPSEFTVLDEPLLVASGSFVIVVKKPREA